MENGGTMMENGGSLLTSLPPNYVTLASLKKRREEEERLKQEEEQRKKEKEEEEEKARKFKEEQEQERVRKLKEEEVTKLKEDETRFKKPTLESATEEGSEISIKKTDDWREKRNERRKRWKQKKAERKANSQDGSTVEVEKQSQSSPNPTVVVVVVVDESKETKPERADREVQVVDEGRRRRWRGGRKEWRKKEESSSSSTKDLTNSVAEIAPSVGGISVVGESNNEKKSSGSPPARNWGFRSSSNWRRGRRFGNRVREDGNLMWVKKEQVTAESTVADSSI